MFVWVVLLVAFWCGGCRPRDLPLELSASPETLTEFAERPILDLGKPEADSNLLAGWGPRRRDFRWSVGERSSLTFFLAEPRALQLRLLARALQYQGAVGQSVEVRLNGRPVTRVEIPAQPRPASLVVDLPHELTQRDNVLEFVYSNPTRPIDVLPETADVRRLAVAWHAIEWVGAAEPVCPRFDDGAIELAPGTGVAWSVPPRRDASVSVDLLRCVGDADNHCATSTLLVEVREFGAQAGLTKELKFDVGERFQIELADDRGAWVRLLHLAEDDGAPLRLEKLRLIPGSRCCEDEPQSSSVAERRPNVLVFLVDTLRADRLGSYGYPRRTSPRIDTFAGTSVQFDRAVASASWTRATVASILTGLETRTHGTVGRKDGLPLDAQVLPEILQRAGYRTHAVFTNSNASPLSGFDRGFDTLDHLVEEETEEIHHPAERAVSKASSWLTGLSGSAPWFLYVHVSDPHDPYLPRLQDLNAVGSAEADRTVGGGRFVRALERGEIDVTPELLDDLRGLYDGEIRRMDDAFGGLLDQIDALDDGRETMVVLLSDHGEEFYEHGGWTHAKTLHTEVLRVPLIIRFPGLRGAGARFPSVVRQIDVMPTVLDVVGVEVPDRVQGRSLVGAVWGRPVTVPASAELDFGGDRLESVRDERHKLILRSYAKGRGIERRLFDLLEDPAEQVGVTWVDPEDRLHYDYLLGLSKAWALFDPRSLTASRAESTDPIEDRLRALGYL